MWKITLFDQFLVLLGPINCMFKWGKEIKSKHWNTHTLVLSLCVQPNFCYPSLPLPAAGFKPLTLGLQVECSTTVPLTQPNFCSSFLPLPAAGFKPTSLGIWVECSTTVPLSTTQFLLLLSPPASGRIQPQTLGFWVECTTTALPDHSPN